MWWPPPHHPAAGPRVRVCPQAQVTLSTFYGPVWPLSSLSWGPTRLPPPAGGKPREKAQAREPSQILGLLFSQAL